MSVQAVSFTLPGVKGVEAPNFSLAGGDDFAARLQLGQIIKGRVLRHYEGNRYGVTFSGREKIVDSAVPLKTGEVLHGKVTGLGDRVELERVQNRSSESKNNPPQSSTFASLRGRSNATSSAVNLFAQHQIRLTPEQTAWIEQAVRNSPDPQLMARSGVLLSKLGIVITPEWLKTVYDVVSAKPQDRLFALAAQALELQVVKPDAVVSDTFTSKAQVTEIATLVKQLVEEFPERVPHEVLVSPDTDSSVRHDADTPGADDRDFTRDPRRLLFNVQAGGSVAHRVNTIPLLVNGRLHELSIAVFEQTDNRRELQATRHRQLSFSIQTEQLGQVTAQLIVTGSHMKVTIGSDRAAAAESLSGWSQDLLSQLKEDGWVVDEMLYEISANEPHSTARAVMQHVIKQESMTRLI